MKLKSVLLLSTLCLLFTSLAGAKDLTIVKPEEVGFSSSRLERLSDLMKADIDKGVMPGAVVAIARRGRIIYFENFGMRDKKAGSQMTRDAIFRIYSMWKPFVAAATMILVEEGKISLVDPLHKYIPEFKNSKVGLVKADGSIELVPAQNAITILDLLRHTSGLTYGVFGKSPIKDMYKQAGVHKRNQNIAQISQKLAKLPLVAQPGSKWEYGRSFNVLSRVLEIASGKSINQLLEDSLFKPLSMNDSGFMVPADKLNRLADSAVDPNTGRKPRLVDVTKLNTLIPGTCITTASDYLRFCQMMLNKGELDGIRVLSPKSIDYMSSDQLGSMAANRIDRSYLPGPGYSFGLGMAVRIADGNSSRLGSKGDYWWNGYGGTCFWIDPREELIGLFLSQQPNARHRAGKVYRNMVYQAILN